MKCPRCRNEWDVTQGPCPNCGFALSFDQGATTRRVLPQSHTAMAQQPGGFPARQQPTTQPGGQSSGVRPPLATPPPRNPAAMPGYPRSPFAQSQVPNTPRPQTFSTVPTSLGKSGVFPPTTSAQSISASSGKGLSPDGQSSGSIQPVNRMPRGVPQRPQTGMAPEPGAVSNARFQPLPHASRLITDPLAREMSRSQSQLHSRQANGGASTAMYAGAASRVSNAGQSQLAPGTLLRSGRYRLHEMVEKQRWLSGVYEATWVAEDAQRGRSRVIVCEVVIPDADPMIVHSTLRTATLSLTAVGRNSHIPTLWDAFSDHDRSFFVFEPVEGESILARMRRTGRALSEQEIIESCLQMVEALDLLTQQSPPFVHGLIRPEHIIIARGGSHYILSNFSIILAGGASQFVTGMERTQLSPYTAPEFVRGIVDVRCDLFSLLATAYHAVTGSVPTGLSGSIPQPQRLNPAVSSKFDAILTRGLRPVATQRYQHPSELRQDLLTMRSVSGSLVEGHPGRSARRFPAPEPRAEVPATQFPNSIAHVLQSLDPGDEFDERRPLLPQPEELPSFPVRNDWISASIWLVVILAVMVVLLAMTRGLV